jgi:hypothetical protein
VVAEVECPTFLDYQVCRSQRYPVLPREFLVLFDSLPVDGASVKQGSNQPSVVAACRCVNVGLFISKELRREVVVHLATRDGDNLQIISFPGETLRRVSPDERSISFFLLKASQILAGLPLGTTSVLPNGILATMTTAQEVVGLHESQRVYLSALEPYHEGDYDGIDCGSLFIYSDVSVDSFIFKHTDKVPRPASPERFILDINLHCDQSSDRP